MRAGAPGGFRREFAGWTLRSLACAAPSVGWAWAIGIRSPAKVAAMAGMIVLFAAGWTLLAAALERGAPRRSPLLRWVKRSAWLKAGTGVVTDLHLGMLAASLVARFPPSLAGPGATDPTPATVALLTVAQGALLSLVLAAIALSAWGLARCWSRWRGAA